ncbi:MAG: transporter substrate-binding domain-containing protein [Alphaproteobacteria bacterium]|nr:transporter substrate-binding domain-containing protein [Alphaproteobacteria bacterium]
MKLSQIIVVAAISAVITLATVKGIQPSTNAGGAASVAPYGKAYERVMRTNTLRCGYIIAPLIFTQDSNTGEMGGIFKESADIVAKKLDLKIEWMETTFGTVVQDLTDGKIDAHCGGIWPSPARANKTVVV